MAALMNRIGDYYVACNAVVVGDVTLGANASIWYGAVIRGDVAPIRIGDRTNVQDGAVLHCATDVPLDIGEDVLIAHHAVVHCRRIGPRTLIGIRATVLDDAEVGSDCVIAAGAVIVPGTIIPDGSVVMGIPGRVVRETTDRDRAYIHEGIETYLRLAPRHVAGEFGGARATRAE